MESWPSIWFLIRSWLTPAVLFLLLNLVIGTIAITSKTLLSHIHHPHAGEAENHGIARTAIHRLRSLSLMRLRSGDLFFDSSISAVVQHKSDEISEVELDKKGLLEPEGEEKRVLEKEGEDNKSVVSVEGVVEKKKAVMVEEEVVEDGVDARADDFINRFRQQLHLQRLDSLLKYKDMISGGR